ncbi:MAG: efflux RND transporter permease subunit [bacterium]|nr:efflux RND transporter permease subunit [bacterium]
MQGLSSSKIPDKHDVRGAEIESRGHPFSRSCRPEYLQRAREPLQLIVPLTLLLIVVVPFSLVGAVWLVYLLGYSWSTAVWVGVIALAGLDAETGVVMLLYLDLAFQRRQEQGQMASREDLTAAVYHGAVQRIRPKAMTVVTTFIAPCLTLAWPVGQERDPEKGTHFTSYQVAAGPEPEARSPEGGLW